MQFIEGSHVISLAMFLVCLDAGDQSRCSSGAEVDVTKTVELLDSEDPVVAGDAACRLGDGRDVGEQAILALIAHLADEREAEVFPGVVPVRPRTVGDYAAGSLVQIDKPAIVSPLCKFLADSDSEAGRIRAMETLGCLGSP